MKKFAFLSAAVLMSALGSMQIVQAASAPATTDTATTTPAAAAPAKPAVSPQVQKLLTQYPKLIARIQPYGRVCFEGEECDITITALAAAVDGQPRDGKTIYSAVCATCHGTGLVGSPKLGDAGAWGPRIAKGKETLYNHAINGFNAMPAKGGNTSLADEEVQNAVDYMISKSS